MEYWIKVQRLVLLVGEHRAFRRKQHCCNDLFGSTLSFLFK